jgi:Na+/H+ antiporter NhaC
LVAKTARTGQFACFSVGIFVFFDDYANVLLAGKTLRPLLDLLSVSREKLAFIVDATAAPIASISPVSSWVGFEVGLIQEQIDRIIELEGTTDIGIETSGFAVFLQSIKYRYYPIFMIVLMLVLIYSQRDFGSMLVAERQTRVYQRIDGGDGAGMSAEEQGAENPNKPRDDQPLRSWNMVFPVLILVRGAWSSVCTFDPFHRTVALTPFFLRSFSFFFSLSKLARMRTWIRI